MKLKINLNMKCEEYSLSWGKFNISKNPYCHKLCFELFQISYLRQSKKHIWKHMSRMCFWIGNMDVVSHLMLKIEIQSNFHNSNLLNLKFFFIYSFSYIYSDITVKQKNKNIKFKKDVILIKNYFIHLGILNYF